MTDVDEQRLEQIRAKIRRIDGHKELSPKQFESLRALVQEAESLTGGSSLDEIFFK
jgi:hypothetical protein